MVKVEATTIKNKRQSRIISKARFSGARMNIAERYCANATTQILYPLITDKKLKIFVRTNLDLRVSIFAYFFFYEFNNCNQNHHTN